MKYRLLPLNFTRLNEKEVLVNELGDLLVSPRGTVERIVNHEEIDAELYKSLVSNYFLYEGDIPGTLDIYASRLKTKKSFLGAGAALHIFVLTLRCNQNCIYCQASSRASESKHCSMTIESMDAAVKLMFKSKSEYLTMEFQGGEPSLEPGLIRYGIELAEQINLAEKRHLTYVLCTNCVNLTEDILDLCKKFNIVISTSLDGPKFIHNHNRGQESSYDRVTKGIEKAREELGRDRVSALMTTSTFGVHYPVEIVNEYVRLGFSSIFLRALNPYGLASQNDNWDEYTDQFITFYKTAFEHILDINKAGKFFMEEYAVILLRKILTPFTTGFVDLQSPAGILNSVIVYNYDGNVYASDESRMLAEHKDFTFKLGEVTDSYEELFFGAKAKALAKVWSNECLAGCSDCPVRPYCGADPVRNYSTQGDMYGIRYNSALCKKNKAIIEYLISLLVDREDEVLPIFKSWLS